jgi:hypothetical protein
MIFGDPSFPPKKYKDENILNYISLFVLYGRQTWSLTLREKHRLKVFENRLLKKISELKRNEAKGERRRLLN